MRASDEWETQPLHQCVAISNTGKDGGRQSINDGFGRIGEDHVRPRAPQCGYHAREKHCVSEWIGAPPRQWKRDRASSKLLDAMAVITVEIRRYCHHLVSAGDKCGNQRATEIQKRESLIPDYRDALAGTCPVIDQLRWPALSWIVYRQRVLHPKRKPTAPVI